MHRNQLERRGFLFPVFNDDDDVSVAVGIGVCVVVADDVFVDDDVVVVCVSF